MNAYMNITARVVSAQAQREIDFLRKRVAELEAQLATMGGTAGSAFNSGWRALSKWGSQLQWAGRQLTANFTAPLAIAGTVVTKWALDNEAAMIRIRKVYGDAATGLDDFLAIQNQLGEAFDLLSVKYAKSRSDVMNIAADWAAAGATGAALARAVEATLTTMTLGEMEAAEATEALIAIQAQYGTDTKGLIDIINILNATENTTGITFAGLVEGMSRSASSARSAGVDVEHLAAMLAAISPAAGAAGAAGNALKTIFSRMLGPTGEARDVLGLMGINIDDVAWKSLNATERLERLADAYMHLEGAGEGMVSSQAGIVSAVVASRWQINRFDVLMRDLAYHIDGNSETNGYYTRTLELLADKAAVAKIAQQELNAVLESNPESVKRAGIVIQNSLMKVVTALLPQILWLANSLASAAKAFSNLDPGLQKVIIGFFALLAILGPPMVLLGSMAVAVARLWEMFGALAGMGGRLTGFFKKLIAPFGGFVTAVSGGVGRIKTSFARAVVQSQAVSAAATPGFTGAGARLAHAWVSGFDKFFKVGSTKVLGTGLAQYNAAFGAFQAQSSVQGSRTASTWTQRFKYNLLVGITEAKVEAANLMSLLNGRTVSTEGVAGALAGTAWGRAYTASLLASTGGAGAKGKAVASATGAGILSGFAGFGTKFLAFFKGIPGQIAKLWPIILNGVKTFGLRLITIFSGPWGWAIAAVITLLLVFKKQIGQFFSNIWKSAQDSTQPLGKAVQQISNLWWRGTDSIKRAFHSLPEGIQSSLRAVVDMTQKAAMKVYEWFSYINPFARHSPSLVENVTNGMAVVGAQFGLAADVIKGHMMSAYQSLRMFGSATSDFMSDYNALIASQDRELISNAAGNSAAAAYDELMSKLPPLYADLSNVNDAVELQATLVAQLEGVLTLAKNAAQQESNELDIMRTALNAISTQLDASKQKLEDFASSPIEGMRAMSDAMFENEIAQKQLRLQLLQLGDTDISGLQSQLASLQGEIEQLRGEQTSLQQAGAGGNILSAYEDQINALEAQQGAINDSIAPMNDLQNQLDALQRQGEILDLENALAFDPLIRQVDQLANAYSELPFADIIAGVNEQAAAVALLQSAYDAQNQSVNDQQAALDAANASAAIAQAQYDAQKNVLDGLNQVYSAVEEQIRDVESAINDVIAAARDMQSALEASRGSGDRLSPAAENFIGAAGGSFPDVGDAFTIGGEGGDIQDWLDEFMAASGDLFSDIDIWAPIKAKWGQFKSWWSSTVVPGTKDFFGNVWTGVSDAATSIDWLAPLRNGLKTVQGWFGGEATSGLREAWNGWIDTIVAPWKGKWEEIKKVLTDAWEKSIKPSLSRLGDSLSKLWEVAQFAWEKFKPILEIMKNMFLVVVGVIGAAVMLIITLVSNIVASVITPIVEFITGVIEAVIQVVTGIVEFITGVFTGDWALAWQGIKDIFGGTWDLVISILEGAWDILWGLIEGLVKGIADWFSWLYTTLVDQTLPELVTNVSQWFLDMRDNAINWVTDLVLTVVQWFIDLRNDVVTWITDLVTTVVQWFKDLPGKVITAIGDVTTTLKQKGTDIIQGMKDGITEKWEVTETWVKTIDDKVKDVFTNAKDWLFSAGKNIMTGLWDGLKDKYEDVKDWFGGIGDWIKENKGPKSYDLKLLVPAGMWIISGLQNGLMKMIPSLKGTLENVASVVGSSMNGVNVQSALNTGAVALAARAATSTQYEAPVLASSSSNTKNVIFYGDLSFPNITDPDDADRFLKNLQDA